ELLQADRDAREPHRRGDPRANARLDRARSREKGDPDPGWHRRRGQRRASAGSRNTMIIKQTFRFEAAHRLPLHRGKCVNLHGHSYRFALALDLPVDPTTGMTIDFGDITTLVEERVIREWDHH